MTVNRLKDFIERVGWTAIYAIAAAGLTVLTSNGITWMEALKFVGISTAIAVCKVVIAQQAGGRGSGDAIPGGVTEP